MLASFVITLLLLGASGNGAPDHATRPSPEAPREQSLRQESSQPQAPRQVRAERPLGVVWSKPESDILAEAELEEIHRAGFRFVRTGPVKSASLLALADSLGITLFRELPLHRLSAGALLDSTAFASRMVGDLMASGAGHPSAGPIGLAELSDVSAEAACRFFSDVIAAQAGTPNVAFYYVGAFVDSDACHDTVDFVLLEASDKRDPAVLLERWETAHGTPAGLGSVGRWVDPSAPPGLGSPRSEVEQARAFESMLAELDRIETTASSLPYVFVHRWRDRVRARAETGFYDVYDRRYGINDAEGAPRPARHVLTEYLTTGQNVFAFEAADPGKRGRPWFLILGWSLIVAMAVLYASSPRFRYMLPRYFMAHGFFRNAVREAREVLPIVSTALLTIMGVAVGQIGTQIFLTVHDTRPVRQLVSMLPYEVRSILIAMLDGPLLAVILIGCLALLAIAVWMGLWMTVASRKAPLLPSQALMLGVWPRWQLLFLLPLAMSIHTLEPESALAWSALLAPLWFGTAFWATIRTAYDLYKITNCSPAKAFIVWLFNPVLIAVIGFVALWIAYPDAYAFLWNLAWRT